MIILKLKILELTKENSSEYIDDVAMLEKKVLETMEISIKMDLSTNVVKKKTS